MRKKKDLPLVILKSLEPFVNLKGDKFEVIDPKENLLKLIDKDSDSSFHFTIEKYQKDNNQKYLILVNRIPSNVNDNGVYQNWIEISGLTAQFEAWVNLLDEYEAVNSFFDDPIGKSFTEEFYAEFEIIEEEVKNNPLTTKQILLLDAYLESVESKLKELTNEENSSEILDINADIIILRDNLTTRSKKWVVTKLTSIWGKIAKQGTKFIKEFLTESKKELIKQSIKGLIDYAKENGADLLS
jgi:hypothetical protein